MRQLVCVVTDDTVRYLLADGDEVTQIAQVINRGLDVPAVVELGDALGELLHLNGQRRPGAKPKPAALPPAPRPALRAPAERRRRTPTGVMIEAIIAYVRDHSGARTVEVAAEVAGHLPMKSRRQTIDNRYRAYGVRCARLGVEPEIKISLDHQGKARMYYVGGD